MEGQLYEKIWMKRRFQRVMDSLIFLLLLLLLAHRVMALAHCFSFLWLVAFLCESWFAFTWFSILSTKWTPALVTTHLHSLLHRKDEVPAVDLFVTTADPVLEPPIITVNTVLSLLALDYPSHKLACYVSDDSCSPLNFYALVEASHFAKLWVPFCKNHNLQLRAPLRYFSLQPSPSNSQRSPHFTQEWLRIKEEYEELSHKIEDAGRKYSMPSEVEGEFAIFSNTQRTNHPPIIKVICENKEGQSDVPHLVYISREKRPEHPHHYKAGAMNVLTRVSGLMSNAPFMLNVDCDMMVNNPKIVQHAMCIFLDSRGHKEVGFVQCFQQFYDGLKDDPFGNQWVAAFAYIVAGTAGLQGPYYGGTNCFHRRKVIYGLSPDDDADIINQEKLSEKELEQKFGSSKEFVKLAAQALEGNTYSPTNIISPSRFLEAANRVARCGYEYGTAWGKQVGWLYGSISEDVLTGLSIHRRGWRSECCTPEPIAFTGCAPGGCISTMTQQKRWASGLLVNLLGHHSPIMGFLFGKIQFRECLSYLWITSWGLRSVPEILYALLSPYSIITNSTFLPKEPWLWIPVALFVIYNIHSLVEYIAIGLSIRTWWNNQRMSIIRTQNPWLLGFLSATLKLLGISDTVFEITQKEPPSSTCSNSDRDDSGRFTFDESPVFVPGTTVLLLQVAALGIKLLGLQPQNESGDGSGVGELVCSGYLVACYWPFLKGLFGKAEYGIPFSTVFKAATMAFIFLHFCRSTVGG